MVRLPKFNYKVCEAIMWTCPKCGEQVERNFEACWNCEAPRPEGIDLTEKRKTISMKCLRCDSEIEFLGTKNFLEGTHLDAWLGDFFLNRERLDVYVCPKCGRVEFFVDRIGEELRP